MPQGVARGHNLVCIRTVRALAGIIICASQGIFSS